MVPQPGLRLHLLQTGGTEACVSFARLQPTSNGAYLGNLWLPAWPAAALSMACVLLSLKEGGREGGRLHLSELCKS